MSDLSQIREDLRKITEKITAIEETAERNCQDCDETIKSDEDVWCNDCGAPARCDSCDSSILDGHCGDCHARKIYDTHNGPLGIEGYPRLGIRRAGELQDQILDFLKIVRESCCLIKPAPCSRCSDATYLELAYKKHMGEIRV